MSPNSTTRVAEFEHQKFMHSRNFAARTHTSAHSKHFARAHTHTQGMVKPCGVRVDCGLCSTGTCNDSDSSTLPFTGNLTQNDSDVTTMDMDDGQNNGTCEDKESYCPPPPLPELSPCVRHGSAPAGRLNLARACGPSGAQSCPALLSTTAAGFAGASAAVDGSVSGIAAQCALSTPEVAASGSGPWLRLDLGRSRSLGGGVLWTRPLPFSSLLDGFQVCVCMCVYVCERWVLGSRMIWLAVRGRLAMMRSGKCWTVTRSGRCRPMPGVGRWRVGGSVGLGDVLDEDA